MTSEDADDVEALFRNKNVTSDVRRKVLAEKRAYDLVKQLIEENVETEFFAKSVIFLSEQHYQDVLEERTILKLCGYPLCDNLLDNILKQQYRISRNRVYDLTQRKLFCSDRCYKASEHVKKQIPTAPLWLRDPEKIHSIELDLSGVGAKGEEVVIRNRVSDNTANDECKKQDPEDAPSIAPTNNENVPVISKKVLIKNSPDKNARQPAGSETGQPTKTVLEKLLDILKEWVTSRTLEHLGLIKIQAPETSTADEIRKMKKLTLLEAKLDEVASGGSKPAPIKDAKVEQEAADIFTKRVEMFYQGRLGEKDRVRFKDVEEKVVEPKRSSIQPLVDSKNQAVIRRNILHQKLEKLCKDLFPHLRIVVTSSDLKKLISTLNLTSTNVILKTNEYPLMSIIIMHILSFCDDDVTASFNQSQALIVRVLTAYNVELTSLQRAVNDVINEMTSKR